MLKKLSVWRVLNGSVQTVAGPPRRAFVLALLDIYKRYGVYIGGQLEYADLAREWPVSGFRRGDLETALDEATDRGVLQLDEGTGEPTVTLLSTDLPSESDGLTRRLRHQAADLTLQIQRAYRSSGGGPGWNGENRRRAAAPVYAS